MSFDARTAKSLRPGDHLTIGDCPGLRLEASKTRRTWLYRYKSLVDGSMRQVSIGHWPAMGFPAAATAWESLRSDRDAGGDPAVTKRHARAQKLAAAVADKVPDRGLVRHVADDYLNGHVKRRRKPKGAQEIERMFDTMLAPIADLRAEDLTRRRCFDFLESLQHIPVQAGKLRAELGAAWDYALDAGRIREGTTNWWRSIMRGRFKSTGKKINGKSIGTAKRVLNERELRELILWLPNFSRLTDDALTLYLWTLARGAEIVAMHHDEISEERDGWWWTVPKDKTKNARHADATDFRVPLVGRALAVVRRRMQTRTGYLFDSCGASGHVEQKTIQTSVYYHQPYSRTRPEDQRPRLTVSRWAPHDLRRTSRTLLTSLGCPDDVGEAMLGHMQQGIKGVYNLHRYDAERRVWAERLASHLASLVS
jgi:hypothetical protein